MGKIYRAFATEQRITQLEQQVAELSSQLAELKEVVDILSEWTPSGTLLYKKKFKFLQHQSKKSLQKSR